MISPGVPVTGALEARPVLKWGPAAPMRTKRAMSWGIKAHLVEGMSAVDRLLNVGV